MSEEELLNRLLEIRDATFDIETAGEINALILKRWGKK